MARINGSKLAGSCKFWNAVKGFGFISCDDGGADVFVAQKDLVTGDTRYRALLPEQQVEFTYTIQGPKALATNVRARGGGNLRSFKDRYNAKKAIEAAKPIDPSKQSGTVKWFNTQKNFGFITPDGSTDEIFFHFSECHRFVVPDADDRVLYKLKEDKGKLMAVAVQNKTKRGTGQRPEQKMMLGPGAAAAGAGQLGKRKAAGGSAQAFAKQPRTAYQVPTGYQQVVYAAPQDAYQEYGY